MRGKQPGVDVCARALGADALSDVGKDTFPAVVDSQPDCFLHAKGTDEAISQLSLVVVVRFYSLILLCHVQTE